MRLCSHGDRYELAEKLTERLDDMGKDLTSMIEEINDASSSLNKNNKPDDPVSSIGTLGTWAEANRPLSYLKSSVFSTAISLSFSRLTRVRPRCR